MYEDHGVNSLKIEKNQKTWHKTRGLPFLSLKLKCYTEEKE